MRGVFYLTYKAWARVGAQKGRVSLNRATASSGNGLFWYWFSFKLEEPICWERGRLVRNERKARKNQSVMLRWDLLR